MIKTVSFLGREFQIECYDNYPQHPSWHTFEDENDLREIMFGCEQDLSHGTFLDCGAAFGAWTLCALSAGVRHAIAWSPQWLPGEIPECQTFARSLEHNGWKNRASVREHGLYSKPGWLNLGNGEYSLECPRWRKSPTHCAGRSGPWLPDEGTDFLWKFVWPLSAHDLPTDIRWIKIDVEGAEEHVIRGAKSVLKLNSPTVVVEHHNYMDSGIEQRCIELMQSYGYTCVSLIQKSGGDLSHGFYKKV